MALGDGIRRNLASVSEEERDRLRKAIAKLNTEKHYPGQRSDMPVGGVSYWYKQDEIHVHTHVHEAPAFIPWHRELLNRFEASIREIDNELSLHYWNWTKNPRRLPDGEGGFINLFTPEFLGNPGRPDSPKPAGNPWLHAKFYAPRARPFRSDFAFEPNNNPFDPPRHLTRSLGNGAPVTHEQDKHALRARTFTAFHNRISILHGNAHNFIGGTLGDPHTSFRDPIAFFLHSKPRPSICDVAARPQASPQTSRSGACLRLRPERLDQSRNQSAAARDGFR